MNPTVASTLFETAAGFCGIGWSARGITRFHLPMRDAAEARRALDRRTGGHVLTRVWPEGLGRAEIVAGRA